MSMALEAPILRMRLKPKMDLVEVWDTVAMGLPQGLLGTRSHFRPAWVMLKKADGVGSWWILYSSRDPFNEAKSV